MIKGLQRAETAVIPNPLIIQGQYAWNPMTTLSSGISPRRVLHLGTAAAAKVIINAASSDWSDLFTTYIPCILRVTLTLVFELKGWKRGSANRWKHSSPDRMKPQQRLEGRRAAQIITSVSQLMGADLSNWPSFFKHFWFINCRSYRDYNNFSWIVKCNPHSVAI